MLVDQTTGDDAGVFLLDEHTALVQTVDFFTPVVDDAFLFGRIAAANALSDVYAMGGRPLTALSIAAFPERDFPLEWARAIVDGGAAALAEAGCALLGGHSVRDPEIKFGYAVTGLVDPARMLTNAGARPGDVIVLTKPLGTGVIATAIKAGAAPAEAAEAAAVSMARLNREAGAAALAVGARAATDITGFGLAGHLSRLARESGVSLVLDAAALPLLPHALELAARHQPGGLKANRRHYGPALALAGLDAAREPLLFDPQTSGGLAIACAPERVPELLAALPGAAAIGRAERAGTHPLIVR